MAEVWVDPDWYAAQESEEPLPVAGAAGRRAAVRAAACSSAGPRPAAASTPTSTARATSGVSRRQAQLTTDGQRWWVEDLQSANGTYVGRGQRPAADRRRCRPASDASSAEDDRIYLGAWTRLVVRRATPEEQNGSA